MLQVGYCDQLTAYLSKFVAGDAKATVDAATAEGPATLDGGYKVHLPLNPVHLAPSFCMNGARMGV